MKFAGNKNLFLGLSWVAFAIVLGFLLLTIYLVTPRLESLNGYLIYGLWIIAGLITATIGGGLLLITIAGYTGWDVLYPHKGEPITMRVLFPVVLFLGSLARIEKNSLREAFVDTNNALLNALRKRISTERVLILLPHCLQFHDCPWKITFDIENCRRCGKCDIGAIAEMGEEYGTAIRVATGGTLARKAIMDFDPTLILAVACGRDLASGIIDAHPYPVYGIPNQRPHGPCFDTKVDLEDVKTALKTLSELKKEKTETTI